MPRIYTRTGDSGETFCAALNSRVPKDHPLIEFMGALDEANSMIGLARSQVRDPEVEEFLRWLQRLLFNVGFHVSGREVLREDDVASLERYSDRFLEGFEFKGFILPAGPAGAAALHVARAIVRRAERRLVSAVRQGILDSGRAALALKVLNRASDALFAAAVRETQRYGEIEYL